MMAGGSCARRVREVGRSDSRTTLEPCPPSTTCPVSSSRDRLVAGVSRRSARSRSGRSCGSEPRPTTRCPTCRRRSANGWPTELPLGVEVLDERTSTAVRRARRLLRLGGQHVVEAVLMGYPDRVTVCVSSQAGCAMGCTFCATGQMGLAEQPHGGRDRRAGGVGAPRSGAPAATDAAAAHERRLHGDGGALREPATRLRARSRGSPTRARSGWVPVTSRCRRSGSCPGSSASPSAHRRSGSRSASTRRATSCAISSCRRTSAIRSLRLEARDRGLARCTPAAVPRSSGR